MQPSVAHPRSTRSSIFLCGGGTGGHVYPALAVAEALRGGASGTAGSVEREIYYIGRAESIEERIVTRESRLPFKALPAAALRGRNPINMLKGLWTIAQGVGVARGLIGKLQPQAILGTGGYVCVPLFLAARSLGVPTMIYLPDVVPGLAVRFLAKIADQVACNVADSQPYLRLPIRDLRSTMNYRKTSSEAGSSAGKAQRALTVTGYPVRHTLFNLDREACKVAFRVDATLPTLLVYGGSLGARSINRAIAALLPDLLGRCQIIHVCGREGDEEWLRTAAGQLAPELQARYKLFPYLESAGAQTMARAFGAADLTICRSGASTLAELPAAGLPAILVPYPYVHQDENADYLVRHGAAHKVADGAMIDASDPRKGALFTAVVRLLDDEAERSQMAQRSRDLARPDAARHLAETLLGMAKGETGC